MRTWFIIIGAGAVVGYAAVYFALSGGRSTETPTEQTVVSATPEPVVLAQVVDVTDTDPLLDPLPGQPSGIPFDPTEPLEPQTAVSVDPATAPMPRPVD